MKKPLITICFILALSWLYPGFSQKDTLTKIDTVAKDSITGDTPLLTFNDLEALSRFMADQFTVAEIDRYRAFLQAMNRLIGIAEERARKKLVNK